MAWISIVPVGVYGVYEGRPQQLGVCETTDDLDAAAGTNKVSYNGSLIDFAPGSGAVCLANDSVNAKQADGTWHEIGAEPAAAENAAEEGEEAAAT